MNTLSEKLEIVEVVLSVFVEVFNPSFVGLAVFRCEVFLVKGPLVVRGQEAQVVWDPVAVLADVEVVGLTALGLRDIGTALIVKGDGNRVRNREVGSPFGELQRFGIGFLSAEGLEKKSGEKDIRERAFHGKEFREWLSEF